MLFYFLSSLTTFSDNHNYGFTQDWLENRYLGLLEKTIYELTEKEIEFEFVTVNEIDL